jgi:anti-anti-sigma factor
MMNELRSPRDIVFELLRLRSRREGDTLSVSAEGELDLSSSPALARELSDARESDAARILLDLSGLTFVDCAGLRVILCTHARAPGRLKVRRGPENVHRVFSLTSAARQLSFV